MDRAALDAAIELGIKHGGWCPLGRLAEDGFIPARYALRQTDTEKYSDRTERNLRDADGTLILYRHELTGGTDLTHFLCRKHGRPFLALDLALAHDPQQVVAWLLENKISTLNVAGPRESTTPGITDQAKRLLRAVLGGVTSPARTAISG